MYDLTVIIPTLNEGETIANTLRWVQETLKKAGINGQILVVDDDSHDSTRFAVTGMKYMFPEVPIELLVRTSDHGLSQSVADGFQAADTPVYLVMDADGQHPVEKIPELYKAIKDGADIAVASRYMDGGGIQKWSLSRKVISIGATLIARLLFPNVTDPGSGYFAVRKEVVRGAPLKPKGYKILIEILGKGYWRTVKEIPFTFGDRAAGESKLKQATIIEYLNQLWDMVKFTATHRDRPAYAEFERVAKFLVVGLTGVFVNIGILYSLTEFAGLFYLLSSLIGIEASIISNYILNDLWTFGDVPGKHSWLTRFVRFQAVSVSALLINFVTLFVLTEFFGVYYILSSLVGIGLAFVWNFIINRNITWTKV